MMDGWAQAVGGRLQFGDIVHGQESVVVLAEADLFPVQFLFHEGVAVQPISRLERKEARHPDHNRPQYLIPEVEVVMREATLLVCHDPVIRIAGRELRHADAERPALLHAFEEEVDAISFCLLHAAQRRHHEIFLPNTFFRPLDRDAVIACVDLHPVLIIVGALTEHLLAHHRNTEHFTKKPDHLLGPR